MKARRQAVILEVVDQEALHNQEELRRRLRQRGFDATQATISRDIADLGLVKRAGDGAYQRPGLEAMSPELARSALERAAAGFCAASNAFSSLSSCERPWTGAGARRGAGSAQLAEMVGTIAGDDTILVIARDSRRAAALAKRLERTRRPSAYETHCPGLFGRLDTSVAIPWLKARYGADVVAMTMDLGRGSNWRRAQPRARGRRRARPRAGRP